LRSSQTDHAGHPAHTPHHTSAPLIDAESPSTRHLCACGALFQRLERKVFALERKVFGLERKVFALNQMVFALEREVFALKQMLFALERKVFALNQMVRHENPRARPAHPRAPLPSERGCRGGKPLRWRGNEDTG